MPTRRAHPPDPRAPPSLRAWRHHGPAFTGRTVLPNRTRLGGEPSAGSPWQGDHGGETVAGRPWQGDGGGEPSAGRRWQGDHGGERAPLGGL